MGSKGGTLQTEHDDETETKMNKNLQNKTMTN